MGRDQRRYFESTTYAVVPVVRGKVIPMDPYKYEFSFFTSIASARRALRDMRTDYPNAKFVGVNVKTMNNIETGDAVKVTQ